MFISWRNFNASTGPVEHRFDYHCARCGAQAAALVRTVGFHTSTAVYGAGGSAQAAREGAVQAAYANAVHAVRNAACPACGGVDPAIASAIEAQRARVEKSHRRRFPVAAIAAGTTLALGAVPALLDLRSSASLFFAALSAAVFVGALAFLNASASHTSAQPARGNVWFWWHQHPYQPAWMPAPAPAAMPAPVAVSRGPNVIGGVVAGLAVISLIASLATFSHTFLDVYVVDIEGHAGLKVIVDGKSESAKPTDAPASADLPFVKLSVRRGRTHEIVMVDASGARTTFTLDDARDGKNGWVIAPGARRHDLCLVDAETVYSSRSSSSKREPDAVLLRAVGNEAVFPVEHDFDYRFEAPPPTVSTKASEVRKRTLRGYVCSELDNDKLVPYRRRSVKAPSTL